MSVITWNTSKTPEGKFKWRVYTFFGDQVVITWNTSKTPEGKFKWRVYTFFGDQVPQKTLEEGVASTRAAAMGMAKRWTIYFKGCAARGLPINR